MLRRTIDPKYDYGKTVKRRLHRQWPQAEPGPRANAVELLGYNTPKSPFGRSGRSERL
jgi:hypothetical protein